MLYNKDWDTPSDPVSNLLLKAADLIERHGHAKHTLKDANGAMCFMGALWEVNDLNLHSLDLITAAAERVSKVMDIPPVAQVTSISPYARGMVEWNNAPERTGQEVIAAMRLAAKIPVPA